MAERATILVVDDEVRLQETLRRIIDENYDVITVSSAREAEAILENEYVQVILCDQRMPQTTGVEFLSMVRDRWPEIVRIIISGYTDPEDTISAINDAGIYQYITKPWHPESLMLSIRNAAQLYQLQKENELLALEMKITTPTLQRYINEQREKLKESFHLNQIIRSPESPVNQTCAQIARLAPYDISVLITGESGTGKELFARALHYNSLRADKCFVVENCGALPDQLLESELFGHKKGAYTGAISDRIGLFEQADGGTIFLDEIGDITPALQVKLLRVLQEGEIRPLGCNERRRVNIRIVAATNRNLEEDVRAGRFREDLYYRLATVTLQVPPLRQRLMDIPVLSSNILNSIMHAFGKRVKGISDETLACMQDYHWPGNVRELQNELQRMLVMADTDVIGAEMLSPRILRAAPPEEEIDLLTGLDGSLKDMVESLEARILRETLIRHRWNKSRAAEELGLSRVGLRSKLERYGLEPRLNS
jgi:two-component system response regulator HupR/HoxA